MGQNLHTALLRWCLIIICNFWHYGSLAHHVQELSQVWIPLGVVNTWCKCMQHVAQMTLEVIHDVFLNYSLRSPVTRRSLCTHVNPPPHHYLCLFCLCHVSGVQKFPRNERVSLPPLQTVVLCTEQKGVFHDDLTNVWCFSSCLAEMRKKKSKFLKTWMMPRHWAQYCPNTRTHITPKCF